LSKQALSDVDRESVFAGARFVWDNPFLLGILSLDLFAVLLGGATTLLPIYAKDILVCGAGGLGLLRSAPALGALLMTAYLSRFSLGQRVGLKMFYAVILFGLCTVVFALSSTMWLSLTALVLMGAVDMVSVIIRSSLVQIATPEQMRGRVSAINFLFINASNQLGGFESGITAALFGVVGAAALGGVGTIAVALIWMKLFPSIIRINSLD
jgi:MFS family permease